ncbi:hypothetical protein NEUTE1DRAFT_127496 [Neurospora tetrasperma FGSC 2508]|uniref:Uncharacterized protein n=1 Tax=Neurospora tetrasperma (strain FGSC 2508 / ATCC MYA-4615 / P0657) TaxID=510951 RepID=F8MDN3_NEUT8|nr:uncharacterized protein NEUTE1DRAFT_127496 [Neurospora tetrasperma FGSC 2508]EGO60671.1 hypothetical protein NEUTE1DRAFT_127496 [Neurospora tetrasperma FGSC 2508]EGZ75347.1 hypothetical protein NEUTE2DRAFT_148503 [Neurospora tetrasperma FGSC 2509]
MCQVGGSRSIAIERESGTGHLEGPVDNSNTHLPTLHNNGREPAPSPNLPSLRARHLAILSNDNWLTFEYLTRCSTASTHKFTAAHFGKSESNFQVRPFGKVRTCVERGRRSTPYTTSVQTAPEASIHLLPQPA